MPRLRRVCEHIGLWRREKPHRWRNMQLASNCALILYSILLEWEKPESFQTSVKSPCNSSPPLRLSLESTVNDRRLFCFRGVRCAIDVAKTAVAVKESNASLSRARAVSLSRNIFSRCIFHERGCLVNKENRSKHRQVMRHVFRFAYSTYTHANA